MSDQQPSDSKLTRTKRQWADQGKFLTGRVTRPETDRLPPGQHLVTNWPVLDLGQQPVIRHEPWRLEVKGVLALRSEAARMSRASVSGRAASRTRPIEAQ